VDSPKKINSNLKVIAEMVVKDYLPLSFVKKDKRLYRGSVRDAITGVELAVFISDS
jgi:hypothetical protein